MQFSANLALQSLTGSEGENLTSNMLSTDCLWLREVLTQLDKKKFFFCKCVSHVIERTQQFGVVNVISLGRVL